jgi:hypothetical protein
MRTLLWQLYGAIFATTSARQLRQLLQRHIKKCLESGSIERSQARFEENIRFTPLNRPHTTCRVLIFVPLVPF